MTDQELRWKREIEYHIVNSGNDASERIVKYFKSITKQEHKDNEKKYETDVEILEIEIESLEETIEDLEEEIRNLKDEITNN